MRGLGEELGVEAFGGVGGGGWGRVDGGKSSSVTSLVLFSVGLQSAANSRGSEAPEAFQGEISGFFLSVAPISSFHHHLSNSSSPSYLIIPGAEMRLIFQGGVRRPAVR